MTWMIVKEGTKPREDYPKFPLSNWIFRGLTDGEMERLVDTAKSNVNAVDNDSELRSAIEKIEGLEKV